MLMLYNCSTSNNYFYFKHLQLSSEALPQSTARCFPRAPIVRPGAVYNHPGRPAQWLLRWLWHSKRLPERSSILQHFPSYCRASERADHQRPRDWWWLNKYLYQILIFLKIILFVSYVYIISVNMLSNFCHHDAIRLTLVHSTWSPCPTADVNFWHYIL